MSPKLHTIKFPEEQTTFIDKGESGICTGIELFRPSQSSMLLSITSMDSKDKCTACSLKIPVTAIPEIIAALEDLQSLSETN